MTAWEMLAVALGAVGVIILVWWLIFETEGVYLGRGIVIWLYDVYAERYDGIKKFSKVHDHTYLAQPLMAMIAPHQSPLVLDIATGTGRLPLALLNHAHFQGRIVGVDLSRRMLSRAADKLRGYNGRVTLLCTPAETLPFDEGMFDIVTCLEALEFMEQPRAALQEAVRVLRPGGLLLTTNRISTRLMPGKTWSNDNFADLLLDLGLEAVEIEPWQVDYNLVWGVKAGDALPVGARPLAEILRCPRTPSALLVEQDGVWTCPVCQLQAKTASDGVIDLAQTLKNS